MGVAVSHALRPKYMHACILTRQHN
jgi:hypothetical protein